MLQTIIKKNSYQDSVVLMLLTSKLNQLSAVERVSIMMGTPANKDIFIAGGFDTPELQQASSNDMVVMLELSDDSQTDEILTLIDRELTKQKDTSDEAVEQKIDSWEKALRKIPDANVALISVPGEYAALEIEKALDNGLHAFVFSDNVPLEDEKYLKQKAHEKGLLVMGPDCGTGIIAGVPLAFTNKVRRGKIGIVGASGTGIQEVSTLIHRYGQGVTNAIGTGGRDLSSEVGAISMIDSILSLNQDPDTEVIIVISKPPAKEVEEKVMNVLRKIEKPIVTLFLGYCPTFHEQSLYHAYTLEEAAQLGTKLMNHEEAVYVPKSPVSVGELSKGSGIKGFYSGGTLAYEAAFLIKDTLDLPDEKAPEGFTLKHENHEIIDLGDDMYTKGKPHPMIDPEIRKQKIRELSKQIDTSVVLFDVVLGYGAHENMAEALKPAIQDVIKQCDKENREITFVAVVVGTDEDPQNMVQQIKILEEIGVIVCENNVQAVQTALNIIGKPMSFIDKEVKSRVLSTLDELPKASSSVVRMIQESPKIVNVGLQSFTKSILDSNGMVIQYDWRPSAGGDVELQKILYFLDHYHFENKGGKTHEF